MNKGRNLLQSIIAFLILGITYVSYIPFAFFKSLSNIDLFTEYSQYVFDLIGEIRFYIWSKRDDLDALIKSMKK